ncbi:conserved hypothetical protein [Histoplasma capsulatum var. duboisii H88]|uniref:Uncharacterized protein n=2 Tax=Ajellomyces capsulatus TaxID=5037 RepID=F0UKM7_AJEC8|nr:conserved hypothetical protein [Histoplasma capsulatum H143]EGC45981.1 conserved hypothetical protein [Histoplasma capsulatum var. duboisii H88]
MSAFGHASTAPNAGPRNERILRWLDSQGEPDFVNDNHLRTNAEIVIQIQGTKGCSDEYIHLRGPRSNLDVDFESSTGNVTITEVTTVPEPATDAASQEATARGKEEPYPSPGCSRLEPKKPPRLSVLLRLNRKICELVKLEELKDMSLLLSIRVANGQRLSTEHHQYGFISGHVVSALENVLGQPRQVRGMQILLPASQIPWKWTAATVLVTFGKMSGRERRNMGLIYRRVMECQYQIQEYDKVVPKERELGGLVEQERVAARNLEELDVADRRDWLMRYEKIVDEEAVVKTRDQWVMEGERLRKEHNALLDVIGAYTKAAEGFEGVARGNREV